MTRLVTRKETIDSNGDQLDEVDKCLCLDLSTSSDGTDGPSNKQNRRV